MIEIPSWLFFIGCACAGIIALCVLCFLLALVLWFFFEPDERWHG